MRYLSTRDAALSVSAAQAIVRGIAPDGGLFTPERFPALDVEALGPLDYAGRAYAVLSPYLDDFEPAILRDACAGAYARFGSERVTPLKPIGEREWALELWHGPTQAFKDIALQMLPRLMPAAMSSLSMREEALILVATSGDTGKAALEGFSGVKGTRVMAYYPDGGVSNVQRLQMVTQRGDNVAAVAVEGNFDDAQTGVKRLFTDAAFAGRMKARGFALSSANSINWGRLAPQIAYYFSAYADLVAAGALRPGGALNFVVPTGNFGNILAGCYARRMGLPIGRMILAANANNVLYDFVSTGVYDINRPFVKTTSPSMDILVSSNAERLLFELAGRDAASVRALMESLKNGGRYTLPETEKAALQKEIYAGWADEDAVFTAICAAYRKAGYVLDPHTAVGQHVYERYKADTGDDTPTVLISTASPFKFAPDVLRALAHVHESGAQAAGEIHALLARLNRDAAAEDEFAAMDALARLTAWDIPGPLKEIRTLPVRHTQRVTPDGMGAAAEAFAEG